uniref:Uncharacterized protein n=1 Tax=Leersia perrieri TaxID=77586 RepID=A0A0D9V2R9_9ORYZ
MAAWHRLHVSAKLQLAALLAGVLLLRCRSLRVRHRCRRAFQRWVGRATPRLGCCWSSSFPVAAPTVRDSGRLSRRVVVARARSKGGWF